MTCSACSYGPKSHMDSFMSFSNNLQDDINIAGANTSVPIIVCSNAICIDFGGSTSTCLPHCLHHKSAQTRAREYHSIVTLAYMLAQTHACTHYMVNVATMLTCTYMDAYTPTWTTWLIAEPGSHIRIKTKPRLYSLHVTVHIEITSVRNLLWSLCVRLTLFDA
jgi:hypothetical protein